VKVLDFGISKANTLTDGGGALQMTKTTSILGSPLYMSPEQMKSSRNVDARTDVWSLGIILYEMLAGRAPFDSDTLGAVMAMVMTEPHAPLESARPDLPRDVCALVNRCLAKDPRHRPTNVDELARGLAPYCPPRVLPIVERVSNLLAGSRPAVAAPEQNGGMVAVGQRGGTLATTAAPPRKRSSAAVWVALALLVGAVTVGVVLRRRAPAVADVAPASGVAIGTRPATAVPADTSVARPTEEVTSAAPTASSAATSFGLGPQPTGIAPLTPATSRPTPRPVPTATAATTKPAETTPPPQAAAARKPGILDTSN
jgi:serine/threonine-protein kinase